MTINATLLNEYRRLRQTRAYSAPAALDAARKVIANGKASTFIGFTSFLPQSSAPGAAFKVGGDLCRWVEKPEAIGLRFVGFADDVYSGIRHSGWYLRDDDFGGELARGVVFQLPGRDGAARYVHGVADPHNDGPAVVCFDITDDKETAARWADHVADKYAETEREFNRASEARATFDELGDVVAQHRKSCLALIAEIKANGKAFGPAICATLRDSVASHIRDIHKARKARRDLADLYARHEAWAQ